MIELLAVTGMVVLLLGFVTAGALKAQGASQRTLCAGNLGQLGKALHLYLIDYDDRLPPYNAANDRHLVPGFEHHTQKLRDALAAYAKSGDVFFCPSDPFARRKVGHPEGSADHRVMSYQQERIQLYDLLGFLGLWSVPYDAFPDASRTRYLMDDSIDFTELNERGTSYGLSGHGRGWNGLFLDGHVVWLSNDR